MEISYLNLANFKHTCMEYIMINNQIHYIPNFLFLGGQLIINKKSLQVKVTANINPCTQINGYHNPTSDPRNQP